MLKQNDFPGKGAIVALVHRLIEVDFSLASGSFGDGGNSYNAVGLRVIAHMEVNTGNEGSTAHLAIYGLPLSVMNQLSTIGTNINAVAQNNVTVSAGDDESGLSLVFQGIIKYASIDAQAMPEVCFRVDATSTAYANAQPAPPTSQQGGADATQILGQLAGLAGFAFDCAAAAVMLMNPYLPGSVGSQIRKCAEHANLIWAVERGVLAVWPTDGSRDGGGAYLAPPKTVGYPMFRQAQVIVTCLLDQSILIGTMVTIQSDFTPACGTWRVDKMTYELEANLPRGKWFQTLYCTNPNPSQAK